MKRKTFRDHWPHLKFPPSFPTYHNLLDLRLLIGDAITVELSGDILCLPHPWHHLRMLLRPNVEDQALQNLTTLLPMEPVPSPTQHPIPLPLGASGGLNLLFQKFLISWI